MSKVSEAAERLRRAYGNESLDDIYPHAVGEEHGPICCQDDDEDVVVRVYLAEHRSDDGEPITEGES